MRPDTPEPILPPDRLDAARMEARARKQPLPGWLATVLVIAALAGIAGFAVFAVRGPNHPDGPDMWTGFILVAVSSLIAMGASYAIFDLLRTIVSSERAAAKPEEDNRTADLAVEHRLVQHPQEPRGIGIVTLLLIVAVLWLLYLLVKPLLVP